ncbi:MAG: hypothetical protein A2Z34_07940 [Planctomycetes bacterium RBG_16_59_8]|nr:MAG: hypothetical protein A2Z34_07940 [Planctomycetes bacterium RBG_16_59_8]
MIDHPEVEDPRQTPGEKPTKTRRKEKPVKAKDALLAKPTPGKTILIVEDVVLVRKTLRRILESGNYAVIEASAAQDALAKLKTVRPSLILVDIMMPVVSGIQFCRLVKADKSIADIPMVMCTAMNQKENVIEAIKAGARDYIIKPFSRDTVLNKVDAILNPSAPPKEGNG